MVLATVKVLDHFSSIKKPRKVFIRFVGRFIELTDDYLILESLVYEDDGNDSSEKEDEDIYRHVLRTAIVGKMKLRVNHLFFFLNIAKRINSIAIRINCKPGVVNEDGDSVIGGDDDDSCDAEVEDDSTIDVGIVLSELSCSINEISIMEELENPTEQVPVILI